MMKPLVTIVTPYKNAEAFIPEFINSINSQIFSAWQCILVDDTSTDNSKYLLDELVGKNPKYILLSNITTKWTSGPAAARNCALQYVDTKYIAFCDIDDLWHPNKLERQIRYMENNAIQICVSAYGRFSTLSNPINNKALICPPRNLTYKQLLYHNSIPMSTAVVSSLELSNRSFSLIHHEDFLFWLNLFKSNPKINYACIPEVLAFYRVHPANISSNKIIVPFWTFRVYRHHGLSKIKSILTLVKWSISHSSSILRNLFDPAVVVLPGIQRLLLSPPLNVDRLRGKR